MLGYIRKCKELVSRSAWGIILLVLFVPALTRAQTQTPSPADGSKKSHAKAPNTHPAGKTFVLVGAGDIASCKNPEGSRATAKLIEHIPGTVFAAGDLAYV
jgi:hypothetical protein